MNVTFTRPGSLDVHLEHEQADGRVMVYIGDISDERAGLFWITPEVAAQWIEALAPLAAKAKP